MKKHLFQKTYLTNLNKLFQEKLKWVDFYLFKRN